jgi:hypothetical protein
VGGGVRVKTSPGRGTAITIDWPQSVDEPNPLISQFSTDELPVLALDHVDPVDGGAA